MPTSSSRRFVRRSWLIVSIVVILAMSCIAMPAVLQQHSQHVPAPIANLVENLTGINMHPVRLVRPPVAPLGAVALIGRQIFNDASLSASGRQSCATCHNAQHAYGPPNALAVQLGGSDLTSSGYRATPSLTYLYRQSVFSIGPDRSDVDAPANLDQLAASAHNAPHAQKTAGAAPAVPAMVPQGGYFWDGRASTLQDQAIGPLTNPAEMANANDAEVARKLEQAGYVDAFKRIFGEQVGKDPAMLVSEAMFAVGRYQFEDPSFHAFSSKYDYWLEGRARLTAAERRGMQVFNDKSKGNCAGCHLSQPSADGQPPLFTDQQYEALAVPRNRNLPANQSASFYDMGICGPFRKDMAAQTQYCGMFLTPTLRNTAQRKAFFHNGVYHDLKQVLDFYNLRGPHPERIYPHDSHGTLLQYDDLPAPYHANVDVVDAPFDRKPGDAPALTDAEIGDLIAFLKTLDDGYAADDGIR